MSAADGSGGGVRGIVRWWSHSETPWDGIQEAKDWSVVVDGFNDNVEYSGAVFTPRISDGDGNLQ